MSVIVFLIFVALVLIVSSKAGSRASSVGGYFAANSTVPWGINGIAFAGGYLSVASFLGICGLIAFFGYDGFLYSIGFLAGWIVALFVIAEPMKRMGTFTFSDALNKNYSRPGIQLAAGISVLIVSLFYLIPQMVGAGVLVEPLLGIPHYWGVIIVGTVVIIIVASGGMTSTTWVQFFNGGLLLTFAIVLTVAVLIRGINTENLPNEEGSRDLKSYMFREIPVEIEENRLLISSLKDSELLEPIIKDLHIIFDEYTKEEKLIFYQISHMIPVVKEGESIIAFIKGRRSHLVSNADLETLPSGQYLRIKDWWMLSKNHMEENFLIETQSRSVEHDGSILVNGAPINPESRLRQMGYISKIADHYGGSTGPLGPIRIISVLSEKDTMVNMPKNTAFTTEKGTQAAIFYEEQIPGNIFMRPGLMFPVLARQGEPPISTLLNRLNFISLMLALFLGTSALPHILIRYYTVPSVSAARKSTIVAIAGIGLFYILTLYLGIGSIAGRAINPETSNMSAPLLARSYGEILFAVISGIAFTTVLATVSGLIMAASGAVAHDLMVNMTKKKISDSTKVLTGRIVAVVVGIIGIILGISFRDLNVSFLVGWAFAIAASANLPSLLFMLFWKKTTSSGIIASILTGIILSVGLILVSPDMWATYGLNPANAPMPINQPGIISIPMSFIVLIVVSLATSKKKEMQKA